VFILATDKNVVRRSFAALDSSVLISDEERADESSSVLLDRIGQQQQT
jgi:hypothetical protein